MIRLLATPEWSDESCASVGLMVISESSHYTTYKVVALRVSFGHEEHVNRGVARGHPNRRLKEFVTKRKELRMHRRFHNQY